MQHLGPYVLERELGRGGMGVVWRAHDPALERTVAVKVLRAAFAGPEDLLRFRREALAHARLRHPAIVGIHAAGQTPAGQPYLVMDHVEGESLAERLKRDGPLPPLEAARVVARLARALHYAHTRGVLHRDLEARNVLLDGAGDPLLIDFGLAALSDQQRLTATGETIGTPGCMAPEQAAGDRARVGPRTDVYGLGAVLHEALTGRAPFVGADPLSILTAVAEQPATRPSSLRPGLDPRLDEVVLRCLEKDPARRYPSAEALADALDALGPRAGPAAPSARRSGVAAALCGLGLVLGGLAGSRPGSPAPAATALPPTPAPTPMPPPVPEGAAAVARIRSADRAGALELAERALASPAAEDLARALLARGVVRRTQGEHALAAADLDAALGLVRSPELIAHRVTWRLQRGEVAGARADLDELARSEDPVDRVFVARTRVMADLPGALAAAEAAVTATTPRPGAPALDDDLRAKALGARAFARFELRQLDGARTDAAAALALSAREPMALLARLAGARDTRSVFEEARRAARSAPVPEPLLGSLLQCVAARLIAGGGPTSELQLRSALVELEKAERLAPRSRRLLRQRLAVLLRLRGVCAPGARREVAEAALRDAEGLAGLDEDDPTALEALATIQGALTFDPERGVDVEAGARALATLTRGATRHPGHVQFLLARAHLRANLGDAAGAEADALALLARPGVDPGWAAGAIAVRARLLRRRGDPAGALRLLDEARAPHAELLAERAVCRSLMGEPREALDAAQQAGRLSSMSPFVPSALARAHLAAGPAQRPAALAALEEALARDPANAQALADRGLARPVEELAAALVDLAAAARIEPWAADHLAMRGTALLEAGDAAGDAALEEALAVDPACCLARRNRGRRRLLAGDARGALVDLLFVTERQPWLVGPWSLLAQAYLDAGDREGARQAVTRCLERQASTQTPELVREAHARALRIQAALQPGER